VEEWAPKLLSVSLKPWQRELIQRVLISQPFARKRDDTLILLFVHLLEKSFPDEPADRKLECLTEYMKGQKTPEPKHTARPEQTPDAGQTQADNKKVDIKFTPVAVMLGRIKDSLAEYFASHDGCCIREIFGGLIFQIQKTSGRLLSSDSSSLSRVSSSPL
jgi:hypothetical protein